MVAAGHCFIKKFAATLVILGSYFSLIAQSVELVEFNQSPCEETVSNYTVRVRIVSKSLHADTLNLSIGFAWECCREFDGIAELKNDTLHVRFELRNDNYCFCTCCYQTDFKIKGVTSLDIPIKFYNQIIEYSPEKYMTFPVTYKLFKKDTVDFTDKYGLKQGRWLDYENHFRLYKNNSLYGWGEFKRKGLVEEFNSKTQVVTLYSRRGKILKQYKKAD